MRVSRRGLLIGAATTVVGAAGTGLFLVDRGVLPGQLALHTALGACDIPIPPTDVAPGPVVTDTFASARRRRPVGVVVAYPPGAAPGAALPVCLLLHGHGSTAAGALTAGRYDRHLAAAVAGGVPPFVLAAMDGGDGYWHPHATDDPLGALLDEFLPWLAQSGLRTDRFAALGWSMGGYGALLCALTAGDRVAAVAASAPALWRSYAEARRVNPTAFDSAQQWQRHDVLSRAGELGGRPMRVDCGTDDSFAPAVRDLRGRVPDPATVILSAGCHDQAFWQSAAPHQLTLIGHALRS